MSDSNEGSANEADATDVCCRGNPTPDRSFPASDRWIGREAVLDAELPDELRTRLGRLIGDTSVTTFADWVSEIRRFTGGGAISIEDLCHSTTETEHWGEMGGERYHFLCFYDAVILAALADQPVDIRTTSPDGTVISATAVGTEDLGVTPEDAVFSFGIDDEVEAPDDGEPSPADIYAAVCPYVRAFPGPSAYETWAQRVSAATVGMPLDGATEVAAALVE